MSLAWLGYAVLVALLLGAAAHVAERALRRSDRPARWAWAAAILGSWILPLRALLDPVSDAGAVRLLETAPMAVGGVAPPVDATTPLLDRLAALRTAAFELVGALPDAPWLTAPSPWVGLLWGATATAALLLVGVAVVRVLRASRGWPEARVLEEAVRISTSFGPAVLGVVRPRIVLPRWVLDLGDAPLRLVLAHELEHRRARDTLLLTAGALAVLAAPWNLPLWWQLRRLRLAVELDCDLRVLEGGAPAREYGRLLVEVGSRVGRVGIPAVALTEQSSFLERRLKMITDTRSSAAGWRVAGTAAVAAGLVVMACETPPPTEPTVPTGAVEATVAERPVDEKRPSGTFRAVAIPDDPLVVVDGEVVEDRSLLDLQAFAIDRVEVLKGTAAVEEFGEAGSRGVVKVWTRPDPGSERKATARYEVAEVYEAREARANAEPLVLVDGVITELTAEEADRLDAERVEVLKTEAARALYGDRAVAGVVRITTGEDGDTLRRAEPVPAAPADTLRRTGPVPAVPADTLRRAEPVPAAPLVFVDGELFDGPWAEARELDIDSVEVLRGERADRFVAGRGLDREGRAVVVIRTRR